MSLPVKLVPAGGDIKFSFNKPGVGLIAVVSGASVGIAKVGGMVAGREGGEGVSVNMIGGGNVDVNVTMVLSLELGIGVVIEQLVNPTITSLQAILRGILMFVSVLFMRFS